MNFNVKSHAIRQAPCYTVRNADERVTLSLVYLLNRVAAPRHSRVSAPRPLDPANLRPSRSPAPLSSLEIPSRTPFPSTIKALGSNPDVASANIKSPIPSSIRHRRFHVSPQSVPYAKARVEELPLAFKFSTAKLAACPTSKTLPTISSITSLDDELADVYLLLRLGGYDIPAMSSGVGDVDYRRQR